MDNIPSWKWKTHRIYQNLQRGRFLEKIKHETVHDDYIKQRESENYTSIVKKKFSLLKKF